MAVILRFLVFIFFWNSQNLVSGQVVITPLEVNTFGSSFRGLDANLRGVAWASGNKGTLMRSVNMETWKVFHIPRFSHLDFRDVYCLNAQKAIAMSSGEGCEMYMTNDEGLSWELVYENKKKEVFMDGMDFWNSNHGIAFGDPVNDQFYLIKTQNGGVSWELIRPQNMPPALSGEAGFAASGTSITCYGDSTVWIGTGGAEKARVFKSTDRGLNWEVYNTPIMSGQSSGIYSLLFWNELEGIVVGGSYVDSTNAKANSAITHDGGETWKLIEGNQPQGYRSCVAYSPEAKLFVACGRTGVDISTDFCETWEHISDEGYYSCILNNKKGWLVGRNGKIAKISWDK